MRRSGSISIIPAFYFQGVFVNARVAACLLLTIAVSSPCLATRYHVTDADKVVRVTGPEISPDGKSIAVVVGRANLDEDRTDAELVLVDVASHSMRVLTRKMGVGFPRWSPDGKTLAFLAADDRKKLQIWTLAIGEAGDSEQLTHSPTSIEQIAWRPDGKALAFVAEDEEPEKKGRAKFDDAFEVGSNDFLAHGKQMSAHLWVVDVPADMEAAKKPEPKRLTSGPWSLPISLPPGPPASPVQWSPDGKTIYFVKVPTPLSGDALPSTVQVLDVATGHYKPLTGAPTLESAPVISPDGSQIAYLRSQDGKAWNENDVLLTLAAGGEGKDITRKLDRNVVRAMWMPDGKNLLVGGNDATTAALWLQPADGGAAQRLQTGDVTPIEPFWVDGSVGAHGEIAFTGNMPGEPDELFLIDAAHGMPVQLTHLNAEIASREIAKQETITWASMKGGPMSDGVVTYPIGYQAGKKYPLVLYIHGGPTSNSKQTWTSFSQLFAAQGWMVFEPNYRGSDNLGNVYQAAIWNDAGKGPGEDVMAGLAVLEKGGVVDTNHIAVSGWSYGGFMTSWLLGHSTIWKASVDGAAVNDWLDMYNLSDGNITEAEGFGGSPYTSVERMKAYRDQSPITYVANVKTPTLVMCDVGDYRVPITQSYAWFRALKDNNVVTQFIAYPVGGHFPGDPLRREDIQRRWIQWLGRYLPSDPGAEAAPPTTSSPAGEAK
jgi:dipeptidyl aminopeptidase/acylaminoacyl peptidase